MIPSFIEDWTTHLVNFQIARHERFPKILINASNLTPFVEECIKQFFFFNAQYWNVFQFLTIIVCMNALTVRIRIIEWERITFFTSEITAGMEIHYFLKWIFQTLMYYYGTYIYTYSKINVKRFIRHSVSWITR